VTEVRRNPITGEPVIFAPDRATRPNAFGGGTGALASVLEEETDRRASPDCPFCPGHEHETPPEIARFGEPWRVRVFANKYPFVPRHEVIVESPRHDDSFATIEHPEEVVAAYVARYRAIAADPEIRHVTIFRNHGPLGGASREHAHSQIAGTTFVPPRVARELAAFAGGCALCEPAAHVIDQSAHFIRFAPHASAFAYEQWIVPRRHGPDFASMNESESTDLALRLRDAARSMERIAKSYNWLFMNFAEAGHWYVQAMPRMTSVAGFEVATGTFVDVVDPALAARKLRV